MYLLQKKSILSIILDKTQKKEDRRSFESGVVDLCIRETHNFKPKNLGLVGGQF